jgi:hypothetical protein
MINGAIQILGGVPGRFLDPLVLAESQLEETIGYVLVVYPGNGGFYDLLFFHGSTVSHYCRLNAYFRFMVNRSAIEKAFETHRQAGNTLVSLYEASPDLTGRFLLTFRYQPCLKLKLEPLSRKQLSKVLQFSACSRGIMERNDFSAAPPSISLLEFDSTEALASYQFDSSRGMLLLYDIEKNRQAESLLNRQRDSVRFSDQSNELRNEPVLHVTFPDSTPSRSPLTRAREEALTADDHPETEPEIDEFQKLVQQIISRPPSERKPQKRIIRARRIRRGNMETSDVGVGPGNSCESETSATLQKGQGRVPAPDTCKKPQSEYTTLFERLFRSFRQQSFEVFGPSLNSVIEKGEREVRFVNPDFRLGDLQEATAISTLELVVEIVKSAPILKRSKLRTAALTLVADLYNKNYDILDTHKDLAKVEEFYCKLKG